MESCKRRHTKYQVPNIDDFVCPRCGAPAGDFALEAHETEDDGDTPCDLLHMGDIVRCYKCDYERSASTYARQRAKAMETSYEVCTCCHGKGYVKSPKAE